MRHQKVVRGWTWVLLLVLTWLTPVFGAHTSARLVLSANVARPGETVMAGIELKMDSHWHTYWRNSGASGMPTTIDWELPPGVTAGEIRWPLPEKLPEGDLTTYVYSNTVVLLVPLKLSSEVPSGTVSLKAKVSWLECKVICVPGAATIGAKFTVGSAAASSVEASLLADWMRKVPVAAPGAGARAYWAKGSEDDDIRSLVIEWTWQASTGNLDEADFYPYASDKFEVQPDTTPLAAENGKVRIRKNVKKLAGDWPAALEGVIVERSAGGQSGFEALLQPGPVRSGSGQPLWLMLLYAFIGGLILNVMPCVLPVISLKILGFVNSAKDAPARVRNMGLIYAAGVLFSFLVLASLVISVKAAGQSAGWGMQFGNPQFIIALGVLITLVALNLFGLFEINPGGRVLDVAGTLASRQGTAGAFFNGVLATVLATPCTAPFLGAALGFAFLQPAPIIILIFVTVGVGLASPYVLLSWNPGLLKFLPKPGAWMERFKIAMGFPMLATAVWLASLLTIHYGARAWWFFMFLVIVALAAWIYGEFIQRGRTRRGMAAVVALVILGGGYWQVLEGQLNWRAPLREEPADAKPLSKGGVQWEKWSPEAVAKARAQQRPVLVDFTADWCLTCQANKKFAIEVRDVEEKLREINAAALLGDYTRLPAEITRELNRYGRAGVPLVLVYPADPSLPPIVLPEALTPGIVLDALKKAAPKAQSS